MRKEIQEIINDINAESVTEIICFKKNVINEEMAAIIDALRRNPNIRQKIIKLDFSDNKITEFDIADLDFPLLQTIDLNHNHITQLSLPNKLGSIKALFIDRDDEVYPPEDVMGEVRRLFRAVNKMWDLSGYYPQSEDSDNEDYTSKKKKKVRVIESEQLLRSESPTFEEQLQLQRAIELSLRNESATTTTTTTTPQLYDGNNDAELQLALLYSAQQEAVQTETIKPKPPITVAYEGFLDVKGLSEQQINIIHTQFEAYVKGLVGADKVKFYKIVSKLCDRLGDSVGATNPGLSLSILDNTTEKEFYDWLARSQDLSELRERIFKTNQETPSWVSHKIYEGMFLILNSCKLLLSQNEPNVEEPAYSKYEYSDVDDDDDNKSLWSNASNTRKFS